MSSGIKVLFLASCAAVFACVFPVKLSAQTATPTPQPTTSVPEIENEHLMTREDRIKAHQARIEQIIQENEKKKAEALKAAATPAPPIAPAPAPGPAATAPAPIANVAPRGARSEARTMLYFRPLDSVVKTGETFATDLIADSKEGSADAISFKIKYPRAFLNPLAIDHSPIDSYAKGEIEYAADSASGEIFVRVPLKQAMQLVARPIVTIIWEALIPTTGSEIKFLFDEKNPTGLFLKGTNILGTAPGADDGVINASVMIRSHTSKVVAVETGNGLFMTSSRVNLVPAGQVGLRMEAQKDSVRAGEEFNVSFFLDNEKMIPLDKIRLKIKFNPEDLEAVDYDTGNWIRKGVNIRDGFAHDVFAFDFHKCNLADNKHGVIMYEEGCETNPVNGSGKFATARFRALRPVSETSIVLARDSDDLGKGTEISLLQKSLLPAADASDPIAVTLDIAKAAPGWEQAESSIQTDQKTRLDRELRKAGLKLN